MTEQEIVPFAETVLFKILHEHTVGTKNVALGARTIRRLEPTKRSETSLLLEIQGVPWDLIPNAPRRGRRKKHPTLAPALPNPRKPDI